MVAWVVALVVGRVAPAWEAAPVEAWEAPPEAPGMAPGMLTRGAWVAPAWGAAAVPPVVEPATRWTAVPALAPEGKVA